MTSTFKSVFKKDLLKTKKKWYSLSSNKFEGKRIKNLEEDEKNIHDKIDFMGHQKLVRNFLGNESPYRGLLLYHGLGSGKTCSSVLISEANRFERKTVVFLPTSLEKNFKNEIQKCSDYDIVLKQDKLWLSIDNIPKNEKLLKQLFHKRIYDIIQSHTLFEDKVWIEFNNFNASLLKKNVDDFKKTSDLSEDYKKLIQNQYEVFMEYQYQIIHYDGISKEKIKEMQAEKVLDNTLVIIDEAHNIGSMMRNQKFTETQMKGSIKGRLLYDLFMKSKNTKFVFLTGTPITSNPIELAYIFNVLKGPMEVFKIPYDFKKYSENQVLDTVSSFKYFDFVKIYKTYFEVTKTPSGYCRVNEDFLEKDASSPKTHVTWLKRVTEHFDKNNIQLDLKQITTQTNVCFPVPSSTTDDVISFIDTFKDANDFQKSRVFMRRILGLTSYYGGNNNDTSEFPNVVNHPIDRVSLSLKQYAQYQTERLKEMKIEKKKKIKASNDDNQVETFRAKTRLISNFIFPTELVSNIKNKDDEFDNENSGNVDLQNEFKTMIKKMDPKDIADLSPKYELVRQRLEKSSGTSVVYSNFKNKSGLYAFEIILNNYDWTRIILKKDKKRGWFIENLKQLEDSSKTYAFYESFDTQKEEQEIIRKIYNNEFSDLPQSLKLQLEQKNNLRGDIIKTLFITPKGAEGITLKNVRQLHVVEHYWSYIRTEQVIGRAVRYKSHEQLEPNERSVEIFKYVSTFGENLMNKLKENPKYNKDFSVIKDYDEGLTSDEIVLGISTKKYDIINNFINLVKRVSFDCNLHYKNRCFTQNSIDDIFHPNIMMHLEKSNNKEDFMKNLEIKILKPKTWLPVSLQGRKVYLNKVTNDIYDFDSVIAENPIVLGQLNEKDKSFIKMK
tara:strand:- start:3716 stop:6388 length:2673 start_codon:yes stop_codon:yes gene_type:complete